MSDFPSATAGPPPSVDPQDPLPESNWLWRRVFVFVLAAMLLAFIWWYSGAIGNVALSVDTNTPAAAVIAAIEGLIVLVKLCVFLLGFLILLYLLAPSAEQLTKLIQTSKALREGVAFRSTQTATGPDGATATARNEAGPAPLPPAPPVISDEPRSASGLLGNEEPAYQGPDLSAAPRTSTDAPEEPQWPR